jgi:uncharacterized membrane protein
VTSRLQQHSPQNELLPHWLLVASTCGAICTLIPVAAHQLGVLSHLPDPPSVYFDSDRITEAKLAHPLGIPDALLGLASYGVTLALVVMSSKRPVAKKLLGAKLFVDGTIASVNTVRQVVSFRKVCSWCTATAICTGVMLVAGRRLFAPKVVR